MKLWSDEIEAERAEARRVVQTGMPAFRAFLGPSEVSAGSDSVQIARQQREHLKKHLVAHAEGRDREIAGVRCRVFLPEGKATGVYLHFHGGGMVTGAPEMNDYPNWDLSQKHGLAVVSVDYRLAPEHPYPAGPDDGVAVAAWLLENAEREFGSARLLTGGESAGGYMAAAVLRRVRDELGDGIERFAGANLVFGIYDYSGTPSQRGIRPHDGEDVLDPDAIRFFSDCYVPGRSAEERRDPAISPAFADLRNLPTALMSVGTTDHLLDDTLLLATRWAAAGNGVELFVAPDMPHGFMFFPCGMTQRWAEQTDRWFARALASKAP